MKISKYEMKYILLNFAILMLTVYSHMLINHIQSTASTTYTFENRFGLDYRVIVYFALIISPCLLGISFAKVFALCLNKKGIVFLPRKHLKFVDILKKVSLIFFLALIAGMICIAVSSNISLNFLPYYYEYKLFYLLLIIYFLIFFVNDMKHHESLKHKTDITDQNTAINETGEIS